MRAAVDDGPGNIEARVRDGSLELRDELARNGREALIIGAVKPPPCEKRAWTGSRCKNGHIRLGSSDVAYQQHACMVPRDMRLTVAFIAELRLLDRGT